MLDQRCDLHRMRHADPCGNGVSSELRVRDAPGACAAFPSLLELRRREVLPSTAPSSNRPEPTVPAMADRPTRAECGGVTGSGEPEVFSRAEANSRLREALLKLTIRRT
jgi:hypothetical protein